jgi:ankyrin repeat protein
VGVVRVEKLVSFFLIFFFLLQNPTKFSATKGKKFKNPKNSQNNMAQENKKIKREFEPGEELCRACESGDLKCVERLITEGVGVMSLWEVDTPTGDWTPLHFAAANGHLEIAKLLVSKGAEVDAETWNKRTPVFEACLGGHAEVVRFLVQNGACLTRYDGNFQMPIQDASRSSSLETVKSVIESGIPLYDLYDPTADERPNPVHLAATVGDLDTVKYLISKGFDETKEITVHGSPLNCASRHGHLEVVKFLVESGVDPNKTFSDPIYDACEGGHLPVIKYFEALGTSLSLTDLLGRCPLHYACRGVQLDTVKYLVEKGAVFLQKNNREKYPIHRACRKGGFEIVKYLAAKMVEQIEPSRDRDWLPLALWIAASKGEADIVRYLAEVYEVPLHFRHKGRTPIYMSVKNGHTKAFSYLKAHDSDWDEENESTGETLTLLAAERGHFKLVRILTAWGIRGVMKDSWFNALHFAAKAGHLEMVKFLVETPSGYDVNRATRDGTLPLDLTVRLSHIGVSAHLEVAVYLIKKGAKLSATRDNWTADLEKEMCVLLFKNGFAPPRDLFEDPYLWDFPEYSYFDVDEHSSPTSLESSYKERFNSLKTLFLKHFKVPAQSLFLLSREKNPESYFYKDFFPLVVFKKIFALVGKQYREDEWEKLTKGLGWE